MFDIQKHLDELDLLNAYFQWREAFNKRLRSVDYSYEEYKQALKNNEIHIIIPMNSGIGSMFLNTNIQVKGYTYNWHLATYTL